MIKFCPSTEPNLSQGLFKRNQLISKFPLNLVIKLKTTASYQTWRDRHFQMQGSRMSPFKDFLINDYLVLNKNVRDLSTVAFSVGVALLTLKVCSEHCQRAQPPP